MTQSNNQPNVNNSPETKIATVFTAACNDYLRQHRGLSTETQKALFSIFAEAGKRLNRTHPNTNLDDETVCTLAGIPQEWSHSQAA